MQFKSEGCDLFKTKGGGNNLVLILQKILVLRSPRVLRYFPNFSHLQGYNIFSQLLQFTWEQQQIKHYSESQQKIS